MVIGSGQGEGVNEGLGGRQRLRGISVGQDRAEGFCRDQGCQE